MCILYALTKFFHRFEKAVHALGRMRRRFRVVFGTCQCQPKTEHELGFRMLGQWLTYAALIADNGLE